MLATSFTTYCTGARHFIHHIVYRCSPRHPPYCTGARQVIHHMVYRCSPRHSPHGVPVLATSFTTWCTGACLVIHHMVYRCSPRHPPYSVPDHWCARLIARSCHSISSVFLPRTSTIVWVGSLSDGIQRRGGDGPGPGARVHQSGLPRRCQGGAGQCAERQADGELRVPTLHQEPCACRNSAECHHAQRRRGELGTSSLFGSTYTVFDNLILQVPLNTSKMLMLNSVSDPLISLTSRVCLLKDRNPVGPWASRSVGSWKQTVLIGLAGFDTIPSIPNPTLCLS